MGKVAIAVLLLMGLVLVGILFGSYMDGLMEFRTDQATETFTVTTGAGETTATITLANELWDNDTSEASVSSNVTGETPTISSYASATQVLSLAGLNVNDTRVITATYTTEALDDYEGAETAARFAPTLLIAAAITLPVILIVAAIKGGF